MIFGAKEEIIPTYYDDDKPKSVQKTAFGLVRIILLWLCNKNALFCCLMDRNRGTTKENEGLVWVQGS